MNNTDDNWLPIPGYETLYEINKLGQIKSIKKHGYTLIKKIDWAGYLTVKLHRCGESNTFYVHRLLATTFITNPENKCCVNHLNGNKLDNSLQNLEWATHAENIQHAYNSGLCNLNTKQIPVENTCTGQKFPSVKKAAEFHSIPYSTCKKYLNGTRKNPTCLKYAELLQAAA